MVVTAGCSSSGAPSAANDPATIAATASPSPSPSPAPTPSPTPQTFADTYAAVASGVVRIDGQTCQGGWSGTGFLVGPHLVATVAHVVSGTATLRVTQGTRSTAANVLGLDDANDVALIHTGDALDGHLFTLTAEGPVVGERVGVIGFPAGDTGLDLAAAGGKTFKEGSVEGLDQKADIAGRLRSGLVELDATTRGGNSGSPVVDVAGSVVGLLSAGPAKPEHVGARLAVNSHLAGQELKQWRADPQPVAPADCGTSLGPDGQAVPFEQLPGGVSAEAAQTLNLYFGSINQADYETAYAQKHPDVQTTNGFAAFKKGVDTSRDSDIAYHSIARAGRDVVVWTTFRSEQLPAYGPAGLDCAVWSLDYTLRDANGLWLIEGSAPHAGEPRYQSCAEVN